MNPEMFCDLLGVITSHDEADLDCLRRRQAQLAELRLDEATIKARLGVFQVRMLAFDDAYFDVAMRGVEPELGVLIAALDERETWRDLVAWRLSDPLRLASYLGRAALLGEHALDRAGMYDAPVPVHRDVLSWVAAGFEGVVVVEPRRAARRFLDFDGRLLAEDDAHGRELAATRAELVDRAPAILVAEARRKAA